MAALPNAQGKAVKGSKVLVLGLSYKADIDDDRESPSFEIIELLQERGADVSYSDPFIPKAKKGRHHDIDMASVPVSRASFAAFDALVVSTAHTAFKDAALYADVALVVDARNQLAGLGYGPGKPGPSVIGA